MPEEKTGTKHIPIMTRLRELHRKEQNSPTILRTALRRLESAEDIREYILKYEEFMKEHGFSRFSRSKPLVFLRGLVRETEDNQISEDKKANWDSIIDYILVSKHSDTSAFLP